MAISIVSYNVNGVRAAIRKGLVDWVKEHDLDVFCLQETKARPEQVETGLFEDLGYRHYWHSAEKKGYSGVATFSKVNPKQVIEGCGIEKYDREGRILRTDFEGWTLLNCYFPSGTSGDIRQSFKMEFLDDFFLWVEALRKKCPQLIIVGDYNIAHQEIDIHDPVRNKKSSGFLPEERAWLSKWFSNGFTDAYRKLHPEKIEYSWWSYRANARANNKGWRIDYQSVTNNITDKVRQAYHIPGAVHSDHCPVFLEIDL